MPNLKDLLKKKDKIAQGAQPIQPATLDVPEFTFMRTTTESEEVIQPPSDPEDDPQRPNSLLSPRKRRDKSKEHKHHSLGFRKSSNADITKDPTAAQEKELPVRPKEERRISARLHFSRHSRTPSGGEAGSSNLPTDLPEAPAAVEYAAAEPRDAEELKEVNAQREAQWEKRATILAQNAPRLDQEPPRGRTDDLSEKAQEKVRSRTRSISTKRADDDIQEAIRLHEIGELKLSTDMFGRLADPKGANNALAQVLYGLALRHGWGVPVEPERAIHYLSLAASNSASVEKVALESGMNKGGAAKGELVLAIFELANCFRHGWGVKKDPVAARQYYETAANLGDVDAMEEAAWCLQEGVGGSKDKFKAAQYLRLAEEKGRKTVGNSWIWKDKYSPKT